MRGVWLNGVRAAPGRRVLQTAPLYLPVGALVLPCCGLWLWPLPAAGQKVGLSPWGTNSKKISFRMLPQDLGGGRYLGPKELVGCAGTAREGSDLSVSPSGGLQPQVGMPGGGPVPLERGQGKTEVKLLLGVM